MRKILVLISTFYDHHKRRYSVFTFFIPSAVKPVFYDPCETFLRLNFIRLKVFTPWIKNFYAQPSQKKYCQKLKGTRLGWAAKFERTDLRFQWNPRQLWKIIPISGDVWQTSQIYFWNPWTILNKISIGVFLIFFSKFFG